jgi:hypothetical protein
MDFGKIGRQCAWTATSTVISGLAGALTGFVYAKLANLPVAQAAKAYTILAAADGALNDFITSSISDLTERRIVRTIVGSIVTAVGIYELRRRGLMGNKMTAFIVAMKVLSIAFTALKEQQNLNEANIIVKARNLF